MWVDRWEEAIETLGKRANPTAEQLAAEVPTRVPTEPATPSTDIVMRYVPAYKCSLSKMQCFVPLGCQ